MLGLCIGNIVTDTNAEGNLQRSSGRRHSVGHAIDHMSLDMVDHSPSTIPEIHEAVIRVIMKERSPDL